MQALTLSASRGWRWLSEGFGIYRKKQLTLTLVVMGYWILMAFINSVPLIGQIAATLLIPVFSVSLMNICRLIEQGLTPPPQLLFSGFQKNVRQLIFLGFIYMAFSIGIFGISALLDGGALFKFVVLGQKMDEQVVASGNVMLGGVTATILFLPLMMSFWFAPVLVAWHDLPTGKSLFFSFVAFTRNWRAFLTYFATVMVFGAFIPGLTLGLLSAMVSDGGSIFSMLFTILIVLVLLPTLYASFYVSYRDVFVTIDDDA